MPPDDMPDPIPQTSTTDESTPPAWRRGPGVSDGTWDYVHRRSIAAGYDDFIAATALCKIDQQWVAGQIPDPPVQSDSPGSPSLPVLSGRGGSWVADFGCGTGRTSLDLADRGHHVLAIDLSSEMLHQVHQKYEQRRRERAGSGASESSGIGSIETLRCNLVDLGGLVDHCVDHGVCMFATLGMIRERRHRREFLSQARRIIRPGGRLVLHVHHRWASLGEVGGITSLWRSLRDPTRELGDAIYRYRSVGEMFMHRYGKIELRNDLRASGWRIRHQMRLNQTGDRPQSRWRIAGGFLVTAD